MSNKPSIPKGTRDFSPEDKAKRNYIFETIRSVYRAHGYREIETPAMELLSTLTGKYGAEGDKLLFRILNSGDALKDFKREELLTLPASEFATRACERGLRYDLTVPFARYVVQHRNEITLPFKRFQIAPVWRADRPQKGRYREFYQCDADVIGSDALLNEVELVQIMDEVFSKFGIRVAIKINNRKLLTAIAEVLKIENVIAFTVAIDKIEKISWEGVAKELQTIGVSDSAAEELRAILTIEGTPETKLSALEKLLSASEIGIKGISELRYIFEQLAIVPTKNQVELDISLARGLDYYTGAIFEVKALDTEIGSITGGGRYDDLTGVFGVKGMSGVGISFGADRIFDVLNTLDLYPTNITSTTQLLFVNFGSEEVRYILPIIRQLREAGITAELYPDEAKLKKQLAYANAHKVPFVAFVGAEEIEKQMITIKDMEVGSQESYTLPELIARLS